MKFLHLADLHIGKRVHGFSMLEDQNHILQKIHAMACEHRVDAVLIAGDVYDKTVPVCEAVGLFDSFLTSLREAGIAVLAISGNHDSPERLDFGSRLFQQQNIHIAGVLRNPVSIVSMQDEYGTVRFHLLPFVKPATVSAFAALEEHTSQCAMQAVLQQLDINTSERNVLLAHQFVTAGSVLPEQSDSEIVPVGGLDTVDAALFDRFDYVALGHLHRPQRVGRDTVRYAGSPLKYSFSEARFPKSVPLVTLREKGSVEIELLPLAPLHEMREIRGRLEDVLSDAAVHLGNPDDYVHVTLTDEDELFDAIGAVSRVYPNLMKLDFDNARTNAEEVQEQSAAARQRSVLEQFAEFFEQVNGKPMTHQQAEWMQELCRKEEPDETD
ncbi:MAG: exonuclease SbcCD subunit D [Butyricicoccus sp.]